MDIRIKNGLMIKDYLLKRSLGVYISANIIDSLKSEGHIQIIIDLNDEQRYETTPCKRLLVIGKHHIENLISITQNEVLAQ